MKIPFPYPYIEEASLINGSLMPAPDACARCLSRSCLHAARVADVGMCSFGFNYIRVDESRVMVGILIKEFSGNSQARTKNFRKLPEQIISLDQARRSVDLVRLDDAQEERELEQRKAQVLDEYVQKEQYKEEFLQSVKAEIQKGLSFVHDYRQINTQISQNINVLIETRYRGATFEDKLKQAHQAEGAIYWASKFLEEKLNVARFLLHPEWITKRSNWKRFRVHGMVLKYVRIYQHPMESKLIRSLVTGESRGETFGSPEAASVIPHTLLDNALKYSPKGGRIEVLVSDEREGIEFAVTSRGPRIDGDEKERIFGPFYRGRHAERQEEEGVGYGLYVAQMIAIAMGTQIYVDQGAEADESGTYQTIFSVRFPYA